MSLSPGTRLGPYEIVSPVGAGGMGEVYKARDTRLDRTVAIKVLSDALAADPEFRDRFEREARVISQLAHPHICTLFDVGEVGAGARYLVLEYLEGETLAARLVRGALKIDDALRIASQIAEALDAAHRAGIVHRDLKPGNVMLTRSGVKLLDFGLAKSTAVVLSGSSCQSDLTSTPTMASPLTTQGTILGTFQYMAPEQIEGRDADARSDIWAFGCILHEILTGKKAFDGKTQAGLIGAILEREPTSLAAQQPPLPRRLSWIVRLCLEKDPQARWQHAGDLVHELRHVADTSLDISAPPVRRGMRRALMAGGVAAAAALVAFVAMVSMRQEPSRGPLRFVVLPAEGTEVAGGPAAPQAAISPDGSRIVFSAVDPSRRFRLYLRSLDALEPRAIDGTEGGELPFWSADGRYIAFVSGTPTRDSRQSLKKVAVDGGSPQTVCELPGLGVSAGGTWNRDDVILFASGAANSPIYRVSAAGGKPEPVTSLARTPGARAHMWPAFLGDGRRFIFLVTSHDPAIRGIYIGSLGSVETTKLVDATVRAAFAPPNYVLFVRDGTLLAQPLDAQAPRLVGEPKPVAERIAHNPDIAVARATFTVSDTGVLVYRAGDVSGLATAQLTWVDRKGAALGTIGPPGRRRSFALSPDETRVAISLYDSRGRQADIWVIEATGASRTRLTSDAADDFSAHWSPEGDRLIFASLRRGPTNMYVKAATAGGSDELLLESPLDSEPDHWSADGRFVIYTVLDPKTGADVWLVSLTGDRRPRAIVQTPADEGEGRLSPDGRWLSYTSNESGVNEVYVQPFPPSGAQWQVSRNGGSESRWRGDAKELYYVSSDQKLMTVDVKSGAAFESASAVELFRLPGRNTGERNSYVAARDGRRFLVDPVVEQTGAAITVVVDWQHRLRP
jgi:eukaryotic-like serine/threonine-protein kinase